MKPKTAVVALLLVITAVMLQPVTSFSKEIPPDLPVYLRDRGTGIPVSIFGTYVRPGELLLYPFYEYYHDNDLEYKPDEFGFPSDQDFRGRYRAHEGIVFIGYGLSDKMAIELEAGIISAELEKSKEDMSPMPARLEESGLSDVEGQIRWRSDAGTLSSPALMRTPSVPRSFTCSSPLPRGMKSNPLRISKTFSHESPLIATSNSPDCYHKTGQGSL